MAELIEYEIPKKVEEPKKKKSAIRKIPRVDCYCSIDDCPVNPQNVHSVLTIIFGVHTLGGVARLYFCILYYLQYHKIDEALKAGYMTHILITCFSLVITISLNIIKGVTKKATFPAEWLILCYIVLGPVALGQGITKSFEAHRNLDQTATGTVKDDWNDGPLFLMVFTFVTSSCCVIQLISGVCFVLWLDDKRVLKLIQTRIMASEPMKKPQFVIDENQVDLLQYFINAPSSSLNIDTFVPGKAGSEQKALFQILLDQRKQWIQETNEKIKNFNKYREVQGLPKYTDEEVDQKKWNYILDLNKACYEFQDKPNFFLIQQNLGDPVYKKYQNLSREQREIELNVLKGEFKIKRVDNDERQIHKLESFNRSFDDSVDVLQY